MKASFIKIFYHHFIHRCFFRVGGQARQDFFYDCFSDISFVTGIHVASQYDVTAKKRPPRLSLRVVSYLGKRVQ